MRQAWADDRREQTTGVSRRQVNNVTNCVQNVNILEFHVHIGNHHEKYIEISTNIPGIGSLIREIDVNIWGKKHISVHEQWC